MKTERRTLPTIPSQMPQAVERVEREGKSKDALPDVLDGVGEGLDDVDDILGGEDVGGDEVGDREAVENYTHPCIRPSSSPSIQVSIMRSVMRDKRVRGIEATHGRREQHR